MRTRELTKMALYVALYMVLDYLSPGLPNGGSVGFSTIVLIIASIDLGFIKGLLVCVLAVLCGFILDPPTVINPMQFILDYFLPYAGYSLAALFLNKSEEKPQIVQYLLPVLVSNILRWASSTLSGMLYYGVDLWGSITYNGTFMIPTIIAGIVLLPLIYPRLVGLLKD